MGKFARKSGSGREKHGALTSTPGYPVDSEDESRRRYPSTREILRGCWVERGRRSQ